ncbi:Hypothetical predicted protein [Mytilus galloprovincialis]|uniref:Uncharacterized protein n=1 Tax=Mytilus galloprovincialis TaxID=29158 RepID=A0A8B6CRN4_MYTGA|nr:Hypothetical predicted protein [Mytilus galloprovincialis]
MILPVTHFLSFLYEQHCEICNIGYTLYLQDCHTVRTIYYIKCRRIQKLAIVIIYWTRWHQKQQSKITFYDMYDCHTYYFKLHHGL